MAEKKVSTAKTPAQKAAKFIELASKRTDAALQKISLLENLAGPGYLCTLDQVKKIIEALSEAVADVSEALEEAARRKPGSKIERTGFKL